MSLCGIGTAQDFLEELEEVCVDMEVSAQTAASVTWPCIKWKKMQEKWEE